MDNVRFSNHPTLHRPPFLCAFRGWNDGGEAASVAARYLIERWEATSFATLDPEEFYDFQVNRPTVRLESGVSRVIEWPEASFVTSSPGGRDVVVFTAPEPNNRWRGFVNEVLGTAMEMGSELVVTLGAFLTDVPHSRPVPVVGSAYSEQIAADLGLAPSQYEGPTGIVGVLHDSSNRMGLPSVSLWAAVPHYLPSAPNPKAALALVERTSSLLDIPVDTGPLTRAVARWEKGVARLVEESEELTEYVSRLEAAAGGDVSSEEAPLIDGPVPTGEAIAAELEHFLREQSGGGGGASGS
ncbi:MAG TPA: carboxylate--amine ligase [Actinobacteria bacterium]|jgi:predicted ATP-grasp superfamily ATP-dependent carboligase|nr:carboxylate--amine ligase [Actinomycetota bacterium]HCP62527.1 carboxylate--amine ligase [Actinomycetota bacterium]